MFNTIVFFKKNLYYILIFFFNNNNKKIKMPSSVSILCQIKSKGLDGGAFALTVHKTQGLTLPHTTVSLDSQMFATGQSYVAISRVKTWDALNLTALDRNSIKTDE